MTQAAPALVAQAVYENYFTAEEASRFTASEIRQAIAYWVGQGRMDLADALVAAGISLYPDSEDILAMGTLVAEVNQDWALAQECVESLMEVQGMAATAETWYHLVRIMRCRGAYYNAFRHVQKAIRIFPAHEALREMHEQLAALVEAAPVEVEVESKAE